jgi:hypothetical protein
MIKIEADKSRNLLTVTYSLHVAAEEAKGGVEQVATALANLRTGFRMLTDLSGLETMDVGCAPHIERVMDLCNKSGIGKVVRIIPDPHKDIGLSIMALFHYRRRIPIVTFETLAEARKELT